MGRLPFLVLGVYLCPSGITYVVYALDKSAAQNDRGNRHCLAGFADNPRNPPQQRPAPPANTPGRPPAWRKPGT